MSAPFHAQTVEAVLRALATAHQGLSLAETKRRLGQDGPNELPESSKPTPFSMFLREFRNAFVYVLLAAAALSVLIGKTTDAAAILAIVAANAGIGFLQRRKAERTIDALKKMLIDTTKVLREGQLTQIPTREVVRGDIIVLETGERVPADARLIKAENLRTDESTLSGESVPEDKAIEPLPPQTPLADRTNMVFAGTTVVAGEGHGIAVATGTNSALGQIAAAVRTIQRKPSRFQQHVDRLALQMGLLAAIGALTTFLIGFLGRGMAFLDIFVFSIASLVGSIPEGLPAVIAITLATGAWRMAKRNAIVRNLEAVETLGAATVILTDKTGTLTENVMTVEEIALGNGERFSVSGKGWEGRGTFFREGAVTNPHEIPELRKLLEVGAVVNNAKVVRSTGHYEVIGDPTEAALIVLAEKAGIAQVSAREDVSVISELPFDHERGWRAKLIEHHATGEREIGVVGAWERLVALADRVAVPAGTAPLDGMRRQQLERQAEILAARAMRILAIGWRPIPRGPDGALTLNPDHVRGLTLGGIVGIRDPLRAEVPEAIANTAQAGVRTIMHTGDHPLTALAIAEEAGILTEQDLENLSGEELKRATRETSVFARISPAKKLRIVEALQEQGEIVAATGDGANDAPALKRADIGIAMGKRGTDVAREASDMVLADDNFASIVQALEEGRTVFANVRKTSFYLLTTNIAEVITIVTTLLLGLPLPLLPIHVLWLNLITDGPPVIALAMEPGEHAIRHDRPRKANEPILTKSVIPLLLSTALLMTLGTTALFAQALEGGLGKARTVAFMTMAFFQLANLLNMRSLSASIFGHKGFGKSKIFLALAGAVLLQLGTIAIAPLRNAFQVETLRPADWGRIALVALSIIAFGELYKIWRRRSGLRSSTAAV